MGRTEILSPTNKQYEAQKSKIFGGPEISRSSFEQRDDGVDGGPEIFGANGRGRKRPAAYEGGRSEGEELMGKGIRGRRNGRLVWRGSLARNALQ